MAQKSAATSPSASAPSQMAVIHFEVCFIDWRCGQRITRPRRAKHGLQLLNGPREHQFVMTGLRPLADCQLYTFVDTACLHGRDPAEVCKQLCDGGSDLIQLRAKTSTPSKVRMMAEKLLPITTRANVWLVINDYLNIADEVGAPICHLGQEDFFDAGQTHVSELTNARSDLKIGLSTH